jgi:hypothetical protein
MMVDCTGRSLLVQIGVGLGSIAAACDRLPDVEVASAVCHLADRLQAAVDVLLEERPVEPMSLEVLDLIRDLERLLQAKQTAP